MFVHLKISFPLWLLIHKFVSNLACFHIDNVLIVFCPLLYERILAFLQLKKLVYNNENNGNR